MQLSLPINSYIYISTVGIPSPALALLAILAKKDQAVFVFKTLKAKRPLFRCGIKVKDTIRVTKKDVKLVWSVTGLGQVYA